MLKRVIRNAIKVFLLSWAAFILVSMFHYSFKLMIEPERHFAELEDLAEVKGVVNSIQCFENRMVDTISLDDGLVFEIIRSSEFSCEIAKERWIGKPARLMTYPLNGELEVYELYVGKRRIFDILWFKSKNRNNEALMIILPYLAVLGWLFFYRINKRRGPDWLNRPWFD